MIKGFDSLKEKNETLQLSRNVYIRFQLTIVHSPDVFLFY